MRTRAFVLAVLFLAAFTAPVFAGPVVRELSFSRKVTLTPGTTPLFRFSLWTVASGGDPVTDKLWEDEENILVPANQVIRYQLGSGEPLDAALFTEQLYVGLERWRSKTSSWVVLGGRTMLKTTAYAISCESASPDSITSVQIADGTVTSNDLQDGAALAEIANNDGSGSGLDSDLLDGLDGADLARGARYSIPGGGGSVLIPVPPYTAFQITIGEAFGSPEKVAWISAVENDGDIAWIGIDSTGTVVKGTAGLSSTTTVVTLGADITLRCAGTGQRELLLSSTSEDVRVLMTW